MPSVWMLAEDTCWLRYLVVSRAEIGHSWLLVLMQSGVAVAYAAIVAVLVQLILRRKDGWERFVLGMMAALFVWRSFTQLLGIWILYHPEYRISLLLQIVSVIVAVGAVVVLVWALPGLHRIPTMRQLEMELRERRKAEESSHEKDERFRNFVESAQDYGMYMVDLEGRVQSWNVGAERIEGYTAEEIIGRPFTCFYTWEDQHAGIPAAALQAAAAGGYEAEGWRIRKDGSRFRASVTMRPMYNTDGMLRGYAKITRDLTKTRAMEHRFEMVFEHAPDAMLICDEDGRVRMANLLMEKLYGYDRAELLRISVEDLMPQRQRAASRVRRQEYLAMEGAENHTQGLDLDNSFDRHGLRRDGREFLLEMRGTPVMLDGEPALLMLHRDITERYKAEQRFRSLLESAPDAMVISDPEGMIQLVNLEMERLFGYAREELIGKPVEVLIPPDLRGSYQNDMKEFFASGGGKQMGGAGVELRAMRKDGSEFPVEINFSPLEGPDGLSMTAAIRDMTERRKAAELLAEKVRDLHSSNEELEQFAYIASHDLQEPLRMVASYTQLLAKRYQGKLDADADQFIYYAVDGTQRMKRLIEDLLIYSRAGKCPPPLEGVPADRALKQALHSLQASIAESGTRVIRESLPKVLASEAQLAQIFQNLIGNAIKYRKERTPEIHIAARDGGTEWIFSVADNGIGIDAQYYERIFLIFQRLHGRQEYEGTGIGLAICKRMLQRMGGGIWVESEPGQGSTFFFSLPKG